MNEVTRVYGWTTSDKRIFKTEEEANHHQKCINIRKELLSLFEDEMYADMKMVDKLLAASIMAEHKHEVYNIIKNNL